MKKTIQLSGLFILLIFLCSAIKPALKYAKPSSLEIKGYVFEKNEKVNDAEVKLYQNNKIVKITTTKNSKFQFILFTGMRYMIELNKPDCVSERIQISTLEKTAFSGKYTYKFRVDLLKVTKFTGVDISDLDFPTAIIKYNKDEGEYMHDKSYTRMAKKELQKLKQAAIEKKKNN
jgi:hypothetical protein